jgi:hypothetical protein
LVLETLAKMPPFSYNVANNNRHQKGARKEASMNTINPNYARSLGEDAIGRGPEEIKATKEAEPGIVAKGRG